MSRSSSLNAIRQHNLMLLIDLEFKGNISEFARALDVSKNYVYRLFSSSTSARMISDKFVRSIESNIDSIPAGWLDRVHVPVIGYVLLKVRPGYSKKLVYDHLKAIPDVKEANGVFGDMDVFLYVYSDSLDRLKEVIFINIESELQKENAITEIKSYVGSEADSLGFKKNTLLGIDSVAMQFT